jgi:maleate cis-trans isomerase
LTLRIGLIIPSSNRMVEQEMVRYTPPGVQAHIARLRMTGPHHVPLDQLLPRVEDATRTLTDAKCDVVTFHCTANSMGEGTDGEERVLAAVRRGGARRMSTTATAIRRALDTLGARRIVLVTPYGAKTTEEEVHFLRAAGYEVIHAIGHDLGGSDAFCAEPADRWRERVIAAERARADAYFLSCANISAFGVIEAIEQSLDRPVVTSNQAVLWDALWRAGRNGRGFAPGRVFERSPAPAPVPA